jgi:DNA-nicking Smr family endonuclease
MQTFRVGDQVQFLDELTKAEVLKVERDSLRLLTEDGFEVVVPPESVILIPRSSTLSNIDIGGENPLKETDRPRKPSIRKGRKERYAPAMEVDLHIEKLVASTRGMSTYDILNYQLETARRQLEFALRKRLQRIVFIHGVGAGVLKAELNTLFRRYEGLRVQEADPSKYGMGATEVYISQNAMR